MLYDEATQEGTLVEMLVDFQKAHANANALNFMTRTDAIVRDAFVLQSGVYSVMSQYRNDLHRMHNTIVQNIQALRTLLEVSEEIFFPERDEITEHMNYLETQLANNREERVESLDELVKLSQEYVAKALAAFEQTKKNLILSDIDALSHEITFLDSVYRVNQDATLSFDQKLFNKLYNDSFSQEKLTTEFCSTRHFFFYTFKPPQPLPHRIAQYSKNSSRNASTLCSKRQKNGKRQSHPKHPFQIFMIKFLFLSESR